MNKICLKNVYELAEKIAKERHEQKKGYESCLPLSDNYELVGVLGEMVFSLVTQIPMDTELRAEGDDGYDFHMVNIKTSEEHKARHLIEFTDKEFNGWYVFVIVHLEKRYGWIEGYIHSDEFKDMAETIDFGYGERLAISIEWLHEYEPKKPLVLNNVYLA